MHTTHGSAPIQSPGGVDPHLRPWEAGRRACDLDEDRVIDEAVEEIGLHDDGRAELAAGAVAVRPVHQNDFSAPHDFFRYRSYTSNSGSSQPALRV